MRKVLAIAATLGLLAGFFVAATAVEASCAQSYVNVWENSGYNGDGLHICYGTNLPDLRNVAHTQAGLCNAIAKAHDDWDDCISSAQNHQGTEVHCVRLYTGPNYTGSVFYLFGSASWVWPDTFADSISSIRWC